MIDIGVAKILMHKRPNARPFNRTREDKILESSFLYWEHYTIADVISTRARSRPEFSGKTIPKAHSGRELSARAVRKAFHRLSRPVAMDATVIDVFSGWDPNRPPKVQLLMETSETPKRFNSMCHARAKLRLGFFHKKLPRERTEAAIMEELVKLRTRFASTKS